MISYAIDIGGSSIKHALVNTEGTSPSIVERRDEIQLSSRSFLELRNTVVSCVRIALRDCPSLHAIGISTTGSVDSNGIVINAGHFEGYHDVDWRSIITTAEPGIKEVLTINDGRAATWAEYELRSAQCAHFCHFVVGTGIGGASIVRGELILGDDGYAGNFGHWRIASHSTIRCSCGKYGCLETLASAPAIVADYVRRNAESGGKSTTVVTFREVIELARSGNQDALRALRTAGEWLGMGLSVVINILNPRYITLGGGVLDASGSLRTNQMPDPFYESVVEAALDRAHRRPAEAVTITLGTYGNDGGIIGAALLASRLIKGT